MYFVYILYSETVNSYYIGQTKDVKNRLKKHNQGESRSTKHGRPWIVVFTEEFPSRNEAVKRERFLKSPEGWKKLQEIKSKISRDVAQPG